MSQFNVLDPKLEIAKSRFLEASAGTGKTFAIEHLIARLVTEGENPLALTEALAVTFTKEAAHEMKSRIRSQLLPKERDTPIVAQRRREAHLIIDQVQVQTIHGFCQKMLTEFAFEAGLPFSNLKGDSMSWIDPMRETVEDFLRTGDSEHAGEISILMKRARYDTDRLINSVVSAMQNPSPAAKCALPETLPAATEEELLHDATLLSPRYKRFKLEAHLSQLPKLAAYLKSGERAILFEEKGWFFEKMIEENAKVKAPPLTSYSLKAPQLWESLSKLLTPKLPKLRDAQQVLRRIANACQKRWEVKAEKEGIFTFDDLLTQMRRALEIPAFLEKVQAKYRAVIVDEFQDTDRIQWEIFEKLFLENHLLYLVGDPKQSIYGFRNADIYTYMGALKAMGPSAEATLDTNFRSSPQLIEKLNALFTKEPSWIALPSLPDALHYHPVKAGREKATLDEPPIEAFVCSGVIGRARSFPTKELEEAQIFPYIAHEIVRLHNEKSIPFQEMAILVKDRFQGQRLQLHLKKWNLPSSIKRTFNLAQSRGFLALEALLQAVANPSKPAHALLGPLIRLEAIKDHPLSHLQRLLLEKGFGPFYEALLQTQFNGQSLLEKLHAIGEDRLIEEMQQSAELLMEIRPTTFAQIFEQMEYWKRSTPEEDERLGIHEKGENKIPILTTFASKGLEFDVVFAMGLASRHFSQEEDEEKEAEKMRQLYVGLTRPKEKLYIPLVIDEEARGIPPGTGSAIELFFEKWKLTKPELFSELTKMGVEVTHPTSIVITPYAPQKQTAPILHPPSPVSLNFPTIHLSSFTSMAKPQTGPTLYEHFAAQDLKEKTVHTMPLGAETGILIHTLFETHFANQNTPIQEVVFKTLSHTPLEEYEEAIATQMEEILALPLFPNFCLNDLKEGQYLEEMELLFAEEERLIKGFADLVFEHEGKVYLVDWKTNWLGPSNADYSQERLTQSMEEHDYFLQARLYSEGLNRYVKQFYTGHSFGGAIYVFFRGLKSYNIGP